MDADEVARLRDRVRLYSGPTDVDKKVRDILDSGVTYREAVETLRAKWVEKNANNRWF